MTSPQLQCPARAYMLTTVKIYSTYIPPVLREATNTKIVACQNHTAIIRTETIIQVNSSDPPLSA